MSAAPPCPQLLERDDALALLRRARQDSAAGRGRCVVVSGEAGIGKSALLDAWLAAAPRHPRLLRAACEDLQTPRPLGPFVDLADELPPSLGAALHEARTDNGLFPALLGWLRTTLPTPLLVIEDLHWADEATLDGLRYLARRIAELPLLLVLSHRDDEPAAGAPLRRLLGALPAAATLRLPLAPLSPEAVAAWAARAGRPGAALQALTGGNPLFITEVLAAAPGAMPASVRDAVTARCDGLPPVVRSLVERVSIAPGGLELDLLQALQPTMATALDAAVAHGLLQVASPRVSFRHELARRAVEQTLPAGRRVALHGELLDALQTADTSPAGMARRVHHAAAAGRSAVVLALAPQVAAAARRVSAHRAAAQMLHLALAHAGELPDDTRAVLLDDLGTACMLTGATDDALALRRELLQIRTRQGDAAARAAVLTKLALMLTPQPEALTLAHDALALAEPAGEGPLLAVALYTLAVALTNGGGAVQALPLARRAVDVAGRCADTGTRIEALNVAAAVELSLRWSDDALAMLRLSLQLAMADGLAAKAGAGWINLASALVTHARYPDLLQACSEGLDYAQAHDLDFAVAALRTRRALALIELGRWAQAEAQVDALHGAAMATPRDRATAALLAARLATLRGSANDAGQWQQRLAQAASGGTEFLAADVAGYAAEAAWLRGDRVACADFARQALQAGKLMSPWLAGRLRLWLQRSGAGLPGPDAAAEPLPEVFTAALAGDWTRAVALWQALGCPYEAALAGLAGDEAALRAALQACTALGAEPAADIARQRLRAHGARAVKRRITTPRAPQPFGLTAREQAVAALLAQGLSNGAMAQRLHRSERTIEHQVAAILAKLGVNRRAQAVLVLNAASPGLAPPE